MREMIDSLSEERRKTIYNRTFLEPCVGTGNFVFAYLRVCKELGYTIDEYKTLLNNIYVCDINNTALKVYRKNLMVFTKSAFDIELDDEYFVFDNSEDNDFDYKYLVDAHDFKIWDFPEVLQQAKKYRK